jgi:hypothetical protein
MVVVVKLAVVAVTALAMVRPTVAAPFAMVRLKSKVGMWLIDDERGLAKTDHCQRIEVCGFGGILITLLLLGTAPGGHNFRSPEVNYP